MRLTSLDEINEEQPTRAQEILGTTGVKDTIEKALDEVLRADLRRRLAECIGSGEGIDRERWVFGECCARPRGPLEEQGCASVSPTNDGGETS